MLDPKILVVDDEPDLLKLILKTMRSEGFQHIYTAEDGRRALELVAQVQPDFIILDVMLPDLTGYEICSEIKKISDAAVFFLTARTTDLDQLTGYSMGADDYICKPFNPLILAAKIKARLNRMKKSSVPASQTSCFRFGRFVLDEKEGTLTVDGQSVPCTAKEMKLLAFFCKHPNQVFSINHLYTEVWGGDSFGYENTVIVHIHSLRKKIEVDPGRPKYLLNIRGLGYKLVNPEPAT
ncbi:response regulator transcription factor [Paenactinomyces guangxiensis]|uniref:Response regulator transcription factor n=1 Tax=Paenactinomyces guangxiensis TaxID=1490290 RepID=A0A7W2A9P3_9BACL|nr:response regulator transcription factor [Paenactinomyces guangxiensis]MBA4495407.1 response regulator transcription factor [Paenactinomyces guangxiensis]MBH8592472.1 response regulator transcription factor [Paenactinomyces guangxiensis]